MSGNGGQDGDEARVNDLSERLKLVAGLCHKAGFR